MNTKRMEEAVAIIEAELEHHRNSYRKNGIDCDPVSEVIIRTEEDHVLFIYDGCGNDYFSYYTQLTSPRRRLFDRLQEAGFWAEDRNNWSMTIREI